jgi:hypothetical protein
MMDRAIRPVNGSRRFSTVGVVGAGTQHVRGRHGPLVERPATLGRRLGEWLGTVTAMLSYLDPGTGSMIAAAFAGGFAGFMVLVKMYGHRVMGLVSKKHRLEAERARAELVGDADADA